MFFNEFVNVVHQLLSVREGANEFSVVGDFVVAENAAPPIFQPFLSWAIAADSESPGFQTYSLEVLGTVYGHAA